MDFSINKLHQTKNNLNFKGMEGAYNADSTPVFKFIAPNHTKKETVYLEIAPLKPNKKTAGYKTPETKTIERIPFRSDDILELNQETVRKISSGFAYRYAVVDNTTKETTYIVDSFKTMLDDKGNAINVIEQGNKYGISPKGGTMRHSFLDSDVRLNDSQTKIERNKEFVRNHFNKLGGSIAGLNWMLTHTNEMDPYRYFMTTPDIGVDKVSSHRYWPSNHYQCSDLKTFKDFNFELFKRGKGYIADGAFTSQGIQSPLLQHVLKWGEQSPFYNMLKIDGEIALGVLPDTNDAEGVNPYEHIGVRLVNPKGANYDKNKPTYIQFYDDRLLSKEKQNDGQLHFNYDTSPEDHYEITSHQDSVQPYAFEVDPDDKKIKAFEGKNAILLKNIKKVQDFLTFPHFTIAQKNKTSGVSCWDGNVDIIKMNLSNPDTSNAKNVQGFYQARDYLYGVATYWSESIQSHLILETAKLAKKPREIATIALKNDISPVRFEKIRERLNSFDSLVLKEDKVAQNYIEQFPLQSLETSEELSAIFAQPQFQKELLDSATKEEIATIFNNVIKNAIPQKYKNNESYATYVAKTYGNEILRHIYTSALNDSAIDEENGVIDVNELRKTTLKSLQKQHFNSPQDERRQVISKIKANIIYESLIPLQERMAKELSEIELENFKLAEAIVLQGKGGLNWRFDAAKDIGDLDSIRDGSKTFAQIWNGDMSYPGVQDFWATFVSKIKANNPSAYIINEVTSLGEFCNVNDEKDRRNFDPQLAAAWEELGSPDIYDTKPVYAKQVQFLDKTNSTTTSEYSKGFNAFSEFAGVNPEKAVEDQAQYNGVKKKAGGLNRLKEQMESLMTFNQPNSAIFSHMFVSNHDKPSVLHTLPLNMSIYMASDLNKLSQEDKNAITELTGGRKDFNKICAKAVGVGLAMKKTIIESNYSEKEKSALLKSLENLVNGKKTNGSEPSFKRAESFGVKPYEITIGDLLKGAGMYSENNLLDFHHNMLKDSMVYFERMWQVMNACVGTPTLYGGNEFVQTGYETPSKNVYLGIRNEVLHHLKSDERYEEYYEKMNKISSLYQKPELSALRDGAPISLQITSERVDIENKYKEKSKEVYKRVDKKGIHKDAFDYFISQIRSKGHKGSLQGKKPSDFDINPENNNHENFQKVISELEDIFKFEESKNIEWKNADPTDIWPIYKKDSKGSEIISVMTNIGLPIEKASWETTPCEKIQVLVNEIKIVDKNGRCPFTKGTKLVKIDAYGENPEIGFVVSEDGKIVKENGDKIVLNNSVNIFYPDKKIYR